MANVYSVKSGLASDPTVWSGGVVPAQGDRVLISSGHVVTLDGAYTWGDDSTATITINGVSTAAGVTIRGTLYVSRSVSSSLTLYGSGRVEVTTVGSYGFYDGGTAADPIPLGVTHTLLVNKSAAMAAGKYTLSLLSSTSESPRFSLHGHYRKRNPDLVYGVAAGAVSAELTDVTGWQVGDAIVFAPTTAWNSYDERTIASVDSVTRVITFAALTYAHAAGAPVGNFTSNVEVSPFDFTYGGAVSLVMGVSTGTSNITGRIHVCNTRATGVGSSGYGFAGVLCFGKSYYLLPQNLAVDEVASNAFYCGTTLGPNGASQMQTSGVVEAIRYSDNAYFSKHINSYSVYSHTFAALKSGTHPNVLYYHAATGGSSGFMWSGLGTTGTYNLRAFGVGNLAVHLNYAQSFTLENLQVGPWRATTSTGPILVSNPSTGCRFVAPDICKTFPFTSANQHYLRASGAVIADVALEDPQFGAGISSVPLNMANTLLGSGVRVRNRDGNSSVQELHTERGSQYRDSVVVCRGASSVRVELVSSAVTGAYAYSVAVPSQSGVAVTVVGYLRKNAAYGAATRPTVTLSGLGSAVQSFTMTDSADTWEKFSLTTTQTSGVPGNLALQLTGYSPGAGAVLYLDGIPDSPWVDSVRHFGYLFDSNAYRTVDPRITLSEAAALARPVAVNHATDTITVTGAVTNAELFQAVMADLCQTANLSQAVHVASTDGANFSTSYTVVGANFVAGPYTDAAGVHTRISAPNLPAGARVQLYNLTTAAEVYNGVIGAGGLDVAILYTAPDTVRLLATKLGKTLELASGVLTSAGLTFTTALSDNQVYLANGIDGATVTGVTWNDSNVDIDISDPDGRCPWKDIYASYCHHLTTATGISSFANLVVAQDTANYVFSNSIVFNNLGVSGVVIGGDGYGSRADGSYMGGTGNVQFDNGRCYVPSGTVTASVDSGAVASAVWGAATRTLTSSPAPTTGEVAAAVRVELADELGRLDAAVSSRLATVGYTAPDNASISAIKATTDALTEPPSAAAVAAAVVGALEADGALAKEATAEAAKRAAQLAAALSA